MNSNARKSDQGPSIRKLYKQPILRVYGGIQDLTAQTATMGVSSDTRGFNMDSRTH
jgi:hypothetical protein